MSDPPKSDPPKFNFGTPATTNSSPGSSLFGTAGNTASGGSLFGSGANKTGSTSFSFSGFGNPPPSSKPEEKKSLFGNVPDGGSGNPGGLFGQQGGGSVFSGFKLNENQKSDDNKSTGNTPSLFSGGFGNLQTPAKTTASTNPGTNQTSGLFGASTGGAPGSIFGNTTAASSGSTTPVPATSAPTFSFGGPSTTPAGPPPSNTFSTGTGAGTGTGTGTGAGTGNGTGTGTSAGTTGGMFGSILGQQGGGLFGQKQGKQTPPTTAASGSGSQTAPTGNLFGNPESTGSGGLFGNKPAGTGPSIFQGFNKPSEASNDASPTSVGAPGAPKPLFNLGPTSTTSTPSTSAPPLFGNQPASSRPASSLFSIPGSTSAESTTSKPVFSFSGPNTTSSSAPAPASTAAGTGATKPLFGIGTPTASQAPTTAATTTTAAATTAATGGLFQFKPTTSSTSSPGTSSATVTSSQPASSLFQGLSATTSSTSQAPTTTAAGPASTAAPATTGPGTSTLGASTAGPVPPAQSRLRNKTMDEILTRWASDLTKYTKEFKTQAEIVAKWDQVLVDNMSKISKLYTQTATSEKQTASVEMQLTAVENQQNELESWLTKYEHDVDEMLAKNGPSQDVGGPDQERERTFKLAERLEERLDDMSKDLESMVEEVNAANASLNRSSKADEPITQIVRILNSHLTQLQTIDQGTVALQEKIAKAQKNAQGLGHANNGGTGAGNGAVEDFYRSYMGRR